MQNKWRITDRRGKFLIYRRVLVFWIKADSGGNVFSPWYYQASHYDEAEMMVRKLMKQFKKPAKQHWYFGV